MPLRLVGRGREVAALSAAVDRARGGAGGAVLVAGEAGMGKTTLVAEAFRPGLPGVETVWGTTWEGAGSPAMWPWIQVLRRLDAPADLLDRVDGSLAAPMPVVATDLRADGRHFRLVDDVCEFLLRVPDGSVRVIVIDDLHWADPATLETFEALARRVHDRPVVTVATYRPEELDPAWALDVARQGDLVALEGLDPDAVGRLLADAVGSPLDERRVEELRRRTGGNPFFVLELGRLFRSRGGADRGEVPRGVRELIERRLARLPQRTVELLQVAAVGGPETVVDLVAAVSGLAPEGVHDLLAPARDADVVRVSGNRVVFEHETFRETLLAAAERPTLEGLHVAYGELLAARAEQGHDVPPATVADHLRQAPNRATAGERARWAEQAAERALAQLAYLDAAAWYGHVLEALESMSPFDERRAIDMLIRQADATRRAGDAVSSRATLGRAVAQARRSGNLGMLADAALVTAALGGLTSGPDQRQRTLLREALDNLDEDETAARARLLAALARHDYHQGTPRDDPAESAARAVELARASGDLAVLSSCLVAEHDAVWEPGSASRRLAIADEVARLAVSADDLDTQVEAQLMRYTALFELGDPAAADAFELFTHLAQLSRQPRHQAWVASRRAMQELVAGRFGAAEQHLDEAATLSRAVGEPDGPVVEVHQRWVLCTELGRRSTMLSKLEDFAHFTNHEAIWLPLALARHAAGDRSGAESAAAQATSRPLDEVRPAYMKPFVAALLVETAATLGDPTLGARSREVLAASSATAVVMGGGVVFAGAADHHLGVYEAWRGNRDAAIGRLRAGEALHQALGARPWLVRSRAALADLEERAEAARLRSSAEALAASLGMFLPPPLPDPEPERFVVGGIDPHPTRAALSRSGDVWTIAFADRTVRLKHSKGLADLARLVDNAGTDIAAVDLYRADVDPPESEAGPTGPGAVRPGPDGGADPVLDDDARRSYAARIAELDRVVERADLRGDAAASERAANEREIVLRELQTATGLGGRSRRLGDPAERARKAVTGRIRDAISRIGALDGRLGAHFEATVSTGTWCSYRPGQPRPAEGGGTAPAREIVNDDPRAPG